MNKEEKALLLKDLCGRLPYNVRVHVKFYGDYSDEISEYDFVLNEINTRYPNNCYWIGGEQLRECDELSNGTTDFAVDIDDEDQEIKPYLKPMSSMTEEERDFANNEFFKNSDNFQIDDLGEMYTESQPFESIYTLSLRTQSKYMDWLNAHHFDYRGLIDKGLALVAPKDMYDSNSKVD